MNKELSTIELLNKWIGKVNEILDEVNNELEEIDYKSSSLEAIQYSLRCNISLMEYIKELQERS